MNCPSSCLKVNNPIRNLLIPTILFVVIDKLFGYLFYMTLFQDVWTPYTSMWRPMEESNYWCIGMTIVAAFYGFVISMLYVKICDLAKKQICVIGFAVALFIIGRFVGEIYGYLMYPYDLKMMFLGMGHGLALMVSWALASKKIFIIHVDKK